ncbi:MAG: hypothetical protein LC648_08060 [Novosphingobium sp.]|nr:hypothetical protein [Novosphingobium sp.]
MTTGWKLDRDSRAALLERYPPAYPHAVADHVTFKSGDEARDEEIPDAVARAEIVGRGDDGEGVEAYVVAIDGDTARPDGSTWHVTWSLGQGREAKESNDVLAQGWKAIEPQPIALVAARW